VEARFPSLELSWLNRIDKWLPIPRFVFADFGDEAASAHYCCPWPCEQIYEGKPIDRSRGIIAVNTRYCDDMQWVAASIAHEWRHHHQWHSGLKYDGEGFDTREGEDHDASVKRYFLQSKMERDAIMFEEKVHPSDIGQYWLSLIGLYEPRIIYSFGLQRSHADPRSQLRTLRNGGAFGDTSHAFRFVLQGIQNTLAARRDSWWHEAL
jgi:hypothetical protein